MQPWSFALMVIATAFASRVFWQMTREESCFFRWSAWAFIVVSLVYASIIFSLEYTGWPNPAGISDAQRDAVQQLHSMPPLVRSGAFLMAGQMVAWWLGLGAGRSAPLFVRVLRTASALLFWLGVVYSGYVIFVGLE